MWNTLRLSPLAIQRAGIVLGLLLHILREICAGHFQPCALVDSSSFMHSARGVFESLRYVHPSRAVGIGDALRLSTNQLDPKPRQETSDIQAHKKLDEQPDFVAAFTNVIVLNLYGCTRPPGRRMFVGSRGGCGLAQAKSRASAIQVSNSRFVSDAWNPYRRRPSRGCVIWTLSLEEQRLDRCHSNLLSTCPRQQTVPKVRKSSWL